LQADLAKANREIAALRPDLKPGPRPSGSDHRHPKKVAASLDELEQASGSSSKS